jgi:UDP-N-acetylglucosamine 2-epimerase (non-hydrolysing)
MRLALTIIGTRPEAIKMAPVLQAINNSKRFESKVCITKQHTDLLEPMLSSFIKAQPTY